MNDAEYLLERRHWIALITIAESGSQAKAARRLNLTESALSHQVGKVEERYESACFIRKTNPLQWTPAGKRLLALAYELENAIGAAERDLAKVINGASGELRVSVECHSCFDWLMPSMDQFRENWPDAELDLVSGFQPDPVDLLIDDTADLVITSRATPRRGIVYHPLFICEMLALIAPNHPYKSKSHLTARDFRDETLITYPIPDERMDLFRQVLGPAKIDPPRKTAMLTIAIMQLVASKRGIATFPEWAVQPYLEKKYVATKRITKKGVWSQLYAATTVAGSKLPYLKDFIKTTRDLSFRELKGIKPFK